MATFQVFRAVSYVYEIKADSPSEAEEILMNDPDQAPVSKFFTDDIYTEQVED